MSQMDHAVQAFVSLLQILLWLLFEGVQIFIFHAYELVLAPFFAAWKMIAYWTLFVLGGWMGFIYVTSKLS